MAERCLRHKAAEVEELASALGSGTAWAPLGLSGFGPCRELHGVTPLLGLSLDNQSLAADEFNLSYTRATTADGERWLRYHPRAGSIREEHDGGAFLELHMNSSFWPVASGSHRRQLAGSDQAAPSAPDAPRPAVARRLPAPTARRVAPPPFRHHAPPSGDLAPPAPPAGLPTAEARQRRLGSCPLTDCAVDLWCDPLAASAVPVGAGYYSPAGDCARYSCTNMDEEFKPGGGGPTYSASGNGTDACPWVCGEGGWGGVDLPCPTTTRSGFCRRCMPMPQGFWSPPMSNEWMACTFGLPAVQRGDAVWTSVRAPQPGEMACAQPLRSS